MSHLDFIEKLLPLQMEMSLAIAKVDLENIQYYSIKIGKLVVRYLDGCKSYINK